MPWSLGLMFSKYVSNWKLIQPLFPASHMAKGPNVCVPPNSYVET